MSVVCAIANCRVSSDEQLQNGSLDRQGRSVHQAAKDLGVELIRVWSGSVSSKKGSNLNREDIREMLEMCKRDRRIKYVIIDEVDRFMRSMFELAYFIVEFKKLGVEIYFATQPNLNSDTATNSLLMILEAFKAEGSNEERQRKSINGQTAALKAGRYTFIPKPGYMKSVNPGIHVLNKELSVPLQYVLKKLASGIITPSKALVELNQSSFTDKHAPYKMDKFRKIATDPYYAGIIVMNKQVKVYNPNGLHEPLITVTEHEKIISIFDSRPKNQLGPNVKGNPDFPLSNMLIHSGCEELKHGGKLVGVPLSNGITSKIYYKYRCRSCNKYYSRDEIHRKVEDLFEKYEMSKDTQNKIVKALEVVWQKEVKTTEQKILTSKKSILSLKRSIQQFVENSVDPANFDIKKDLLDLIKSKKNALKEAELLLNRLETSIEDDREKFMIFAIDFLDHTGTNLLKSSMSRENRIRCKQLLFPSGISINNKDGVYTSKVSVFYRVLNTKKDTGVPSFSQLVRVRRL